MTFSAIMSASPEGSVLKEARFDTEAEAMAHVASVADLHPAAFVVPTPAAPIEDWRANPTLRAVSVSSPSAARRAAQLGLSAADFYDAILSSSVVDLSGVWAGETVRAWLVRTILASDLAPVIRQRAASRAETATRFLRSDPQFPGMIDLVASILPRADGAPGGLTGDEVDQLFIAAAGA